MMNLQEQTLEQLLKPNKKYTRGRRGITDFLVVCDNTNNTGDVIDRNEFVAEIFYAQSFNQFH